MSRTRSKGKECAQAIKSLIKESLATYTFENNYSPFFKPTKTQEQVIEKCSSHEKNSGYVKSRS